MGLGRPSVAECRGVVSAHGPIPQHAQLLLAAGRPRPIRRSSHHGSLANVGRVARAKLEYQISRPLFIRLVGQYIQDHTDSLRDDSRTNAPILITGPGGVTRSAASATNLILDRKSTRLNSSH